jgi:mono/diheme cytochrome c family protein
MSDVSATVVAPTRKPRLPLAARGLLFAMPLVLAVIVGYGGWKGTDWLNAPKARPTELTHAGTDPDGGALYNLHCARCHGVNGDGNGQTPMSPKARHFGYERFKFTDTLNGLRQPQGAAGTLGGIPTDEVLVALLRRGIAGSPMPAFDTLKEEELRAIVGYVRTRFLKPDRLMAARLAIELEKAKKDEEFDPKKDWPPKQDKQDKWYLEVVADVTASEPCPVPTPFPAAKPGYEQRAAVLFNKLGCLGCHGEKGTGTFDPNRKNDNGTLAYPRDLTAGVYKGGPEPEHVYRRIYLGIPGTPMKAFGKEATPDEIVDLVYYVKRFATAPAPTGTPATRQ